MNIRQELVLLAELGHLDKKIKELETKLKVVPEKADKARSVADQEVEKEKTVSSQLAELQAKKKELDRDVAVERTNLRKWEQRADKIKGEREYSALVSEIGTQKKVISNLETQILELMEELDDRQKSYQSIEKRAKETFEHAESEWVVVKEEVENLQRELENTQKQHAHFLAKLQPVWSKRYMQIRERRAGQGVSVVAKEVCQVCQRALPPQLFIQVARQEVIEQCPYCQRILVTENLIQIEKPSL